ncbi:Vegetative incompatibility protein HET-E-1 [Cladobotryum mycophilum]|uniref:Vegetative incompatibility protein HET-E-1 n=1 Tax=Cladobotryum mycophilum TaxID=491253 RepID=A0ABR0SG23_9HYPO
MHLIHISPKKKGQSFEIQLEYHGGEVQPYAILSHRWGRPEDEVTFQDLMLQSKNAKQKKGYRKVEECCRKALEHKLSYAWIDTCCIDKSSSAELSEAINSMYAWYAAASVCFAYLEDVPAAESEMGGFRKTDVRTSNWFTRGWTLQELIAPKEVIFFNGNWDPRPIGTKSSLSDLIQEITQIRKVFLLDRNKVPNASVAERMSWASRRKTTRLEDEAYCLMGLFGVNMPTIYGEKRNAFRRLQEEIMRFSTDHSIFAWEGDGNVLGMLATSPAQFENSSKYVPMDYIKFATKSGINDENELSLPSQTHVGCAQPNYSMTNFGLQIQLPIVSLKVRRFEDIFLAFLACTWKDRPVIIFLRQRPGRPKSHFYRTSFDHMSLVHKDILSRVWKSYGITVRQAIWISAWENYGQWAPHPSLTVPSNSEEFHIRIHADAFQDMDRTTLTWFPEKLYDQDNCYLKLGPGQHVAFLATTRSRNGARPIEFAFVLGLLDDYVWMSCDIDGGECMYGSPRQYHDSHDLFTIVSGGIGLSPIKLADVSGIRFGGKKLGAHGRSGSMRLSVRMFSSEPSLSYSRSQILG